MGGSFPRAEVRDQFVGTGGFPKDPLGAPAPLLLLLAKACPREATFGSPVLWV